MLEMEMGWKGGITYILFLFKSSGKYVLVVAVRAIPSRRSEAVEFSMCVECVVM